MQEIKIISNKTYIKIYPGSVDITYVYMYDEAEYLFITRLF